MAAGMASFQPEESKQAESTSAIPTSLSPGLIAQMNELSDKLIESRKQLKPPANYPQRENIGQFAEAVNGTLRIQENGTVDSLDVSTAASGNVMVTTSGNEVKILDNRGSLVETLPIDKRVTMAKFAPKSDQIAILAFQKSTESQLQSNQVTGQIWNLQTKEKLYDIVCHSEALTDVCFTPLEGLVAVSSADGSWSMHDYVQKKQILLLREQATITSMQIHPDGLIMAIGLSNGKLLIYDIRDMSMANELEGPSQTAVSSIEFSNKGIFLAASWQGSDTCRVYSLHKGFTFAELKQDSEVSSIAFDQYGGFLAVGSL